MTKLHCDCNMLNSMYHILLVDNIYLAIEEAHAMGTYWHGGHSTVDDLGCSPSNMFSKPVRVSVLKAAITGPLNP
jgi:hypothetical protein